MAGRLSQKQVEEEFYAECKAAGVPTYKSEKVNFGKKNLKRGFFIMQGAYGGIKLQFQYKCGGVSSVSSGYVGAREMALWLANFDPVASYKSYHKREIEFCKSKQIREKAMKGRLT
jgi:hypothetical protein